MKMKKLIPAALSLAMMASVSAGAAWNGNVKWEVKVYPNRTQQTTQYQPSQQQLEWIQQFCKKYNICLCGQPDCPSRNPDTTPDTKPDTNPDTTPDTRPDTNPDTKPDTKPDTTPDTKPEQGSSTAQSSFVTQVVELVNEERAKAGLGAVTINTKVQQAAQVRAAEQVKSFSHTRPNGTSCFTALSEAGVSYRGAGENIAYGQRTPQEVMNAWMNSAGHRANILNKNFKNIGVGYTVVNGVPYWAQMFTY